MDWAVVPTGLLLAVMLFSPSIFGQERPRVVIPHEGEPLVVVADTIETAADGQLIASGDVVATYTEATLNAPSIIYNPETGILRIDGTFELQRGTSWLTGSRAELDVKNDTGIIYDASGYTDEEMYVRAETLTKVDKDTYVAESGHITACSDYLPKWSFRISRATINVNSTARFSNTLFRVKKIPVFYFPYMIFPTGKKDRSSGFMPPSIGNSNNKGRRISNSFYLVLGRSADIRLNQDYYSKRGFGGGFDLRTRPNDVTVFDLNGEFVDDKLGNGGASLAGIGHTRFGKGFRAAADFNLVSNFRFRQAFSDNFFMATRPTESSRLFVTNNFGKSSFNLLFSRQETSSPRRNIVTQTTPGLSFRLLSQRIPNTPFFIDLDTAAEGLNRSDRFIETPKVSQRLDLFPRVYFSVPLFQGLKISPSIGFRETFYSDRLTEEDGETIVTGESLRREYLNITVDLKGWGLSKVYGSDQESRWKHLIEPRVRYRYITGIDNFHETIRFDEVDAIANTNEVEYSLVNRFFTKRSRRGQTRELLSIRIGQKYFFDPTFGDSIREGSINQFFPLNTLTGIPYAIGPRDFSPITTVVTYSPASDLRVDLRGDYDADRGEFRGLSVTGYLRRELFNIATTYFVTEDLIEGLGSTNQVQARIGIGQLERGLSAYGGFSYDAQETRLLNHLVRVSYFWDCCGISGELRGFNLTNRDERQIRFSFFLKGIGSFGTLNRPDSVF